jgi:starvation-inducible DNA-binding protein
MVQYIDNGQREKIVEQLQHILADTFVLYFKTHTYHWNVTGVHFDMFHKLFGDQYTEMWEAMDDIAERIRALGMMAPMNVAEMMKPSDLSENTSKMSSLDMVVDLAKSHETVSRHIANAIEVTSSFGDEVTTDLLIGRQTVHDKTAWMLNATASE